MKSTGGRRAAPADDRRDGEPATKDRGAVVHRRARLALSLAVVLVNANCFVDRSGIGWSIEFDARPTYLCSGESARVSWDAGRPDADEGFNLTLTRRPGGTLEPPRPLSPVDSVSFVPRVPDDAAGVQDTEISGLFSRRPPEADGAVLRSRTDRVLVLGPEAVYPHLESFRWGCDNAAGGGAGYSRVDWAPGEMGSDRIRLGRIRNLSPVSVRVGLTRITVARERIDTEILAPGGVSSDVFAGAFFGVLTAAPEDLDSYGPDGCDSGRPPGDVVSAPGEEPMIILPRPDIDLELQVHCGPS